MIVLTVLVPLLSRVIVITSASALSLFLSASRNMRVITDERWQPACGALVFETVIMYLVRDKPCKNSGLASTSSIASHQKKACD